MENIEIFFAKNPDTPPRTTETTTSEERKSNWDKRIIKAKEQAKLKPILFTKVFSFANEFINMLRSRNELDEKENIALLALDDENQATALLRVDVVGKIQNGIKKNVGMKNMISNTNE